MTRRSASISQLVGWAGLGCFALLLTSGCAAPTATVASKPHYDVVQRRQTPAQRAIAVIDGYKRESGCKGRAYDAAHRYAANWLDSVVSVPTDTRRVTDAMENGRFRLRLAQTAARKKCFDVARVTYLEVNEIFTGEPYSALRARANVGLTTLPEGQAHTLPANADAAARVE